MKQKQITIPQKEVQRMLNKSMIACATEFKNIIEDNKRYQDLFCALIRYLSRNEKSFIPLDLHDEEMNLIVNDTFREVEALKEELRGLKSKLYEHCNE